MFRSRRRTSKEQGPAALFLGARLADPLHNPVDLPPEFARVASMTQQVLEAYRAGEINDATAAAALAKLVVVDADGDEWTIGASSKGWYRRSEGLPWASATPPPPGSEVAGPMAFDDLASIMSEAAASAEHATDLTPEPPFGDMPAEPDPTAADPAPLWDVPEADDALMEELLGPSTLNDEDPLGPEPGLTRDGIGGHSRHIRTDRAPDLVDLDPADLELLDQTSGWADDAGEAGSTPMDPDTPVTDDPADGSVTDDPVGPARPGLSDYDLDDDEPVGTDPLS